MIRFLVSRSVFVLLLLSAFPALINTSSANGTDRDGYTARGMAMGGAEVADPRDPLAAFGSNPGALSRFRQLHATVNLVGVMAEGEFTDGLGNRNDLRTDAGLFPEFALAFPFTEDFTGGAYFIVDQAAFADWRYQDARGGIDGMTSYGSQTHRSEFLVMEAGVGMAYQMTDSLSLGTKLGLVYHEISIKVPFIFQSEPTLVGWKTLLDMETDGFGWTADLGALYEITDNLSIGLHYGLRTKLKGDGRATGDVYAQLESLDLVGVPSQFRYDAEVETALPQILSAGLAWRAHPKWQLALQVDWTGWNSAFDTLKVDLDHGSNDAINGLTGSDSLRDRVPIGWEDRFIYRVGVEYAATDHLSLRAGYSYGRSPIPSPWVTPVNAAISEHSLSFGIGYETQGWQIDLGYQYDLPNSEGPTQSGYRSGEYSNTQVELESHWLGLSVSRQF